MEKRLFFLIIILFATLSVKLQAQNIRLYAKPGYNNVYRDSYFEKGIEGSPYMDDWQSADIFFKNGKSVSGLKFRYNVYSNQMLYQDNNQTYIIGTPDSISEVRFFNKTFMYKEYKKNDKTDKCLFEVLFNGKVSLLNKYDVELIPATYNVAFATGNKNDRFSIKKQLYFQKEKLIVPVGKKSKLIELLSDKKDEISDFINSKKLSVKNEKDLILILVYYDQLK